MELFFPSLTPFAFLNARLVAIVAFLPSYLWWVALEPLILPIFITSVLIKMIHWINSFTRRQIGLNSRLRRFPTPICFAEATSLPTIHLYGLSILVKMTFLLEMDTTCFSRWFTLSKLISCSKFGSSSLNDWPLNMFFALSLLMLPFMIIKEEMNT